MNRTPRLFTNQFQPQVKQERSERSQTGWRTYDSGNLARVQIRQYQLREFPRYDSRRGRSHDILLRLGRRIRRPRNVYRRIDRCNCFDRAAARVGIRVDKGQ